MASMDSAVPNSKVGVNGNNSEVSAAEKLMQTHDDTHQTTIEDVPDEEDLKHGEQPISSNILESTEENSPAPGWVAPMSAKAAGKQKAETFPGKENKKLIDTQSEELFPGLGPAKPKQPPSAVPVWNIKKPSASPVTNGTSNGISTNGTSTPTSGLNTPPSASSQGQSRDGPALKMNALPGQVSRRMAMAQDEILPRAQLKKPLPDILKDLNKKSKANITMQTGEKGMMWFNAVGPQAAADQAIRDVVAQIGLKTTRSISIPRSARAHIIGKQGSTIKSLQERTGARIQMPKMDDTSSPADDDDDAVVDVLVEGNSLQIRAAIDAVTKIANERTATVNTKLRNIPAEFYPFIAGPHDSRVTALEEAKGIQINVPSHHKWTTQPPPKVPSRGQVPAFVPAVGDNHISLSGDRLAVQAARAEIEQLVQELQQELTIRECEIENNRHQFIIGDRGIRPQDFFAETGCAIILPGDAKYETITIVGHADQVKAAEDKAMDLAWTWQSSNLDISQQHRTKPELALEHAHNVTQYLRNRKVIEQIEQLHQAHIFTPVDMENQKRTWQPSWQLFSQQGRNAGRARSEITNIIQAHPPSRMTTIKTADVDPFFHKYIRDDITPRVKKEFGVYVITPPEFDAEAPLLLVFEGENGLDSAYQVPRGQPSPEEIRAFQQSLEDARSHILEIISSQPKLSEADIEVPRIFHEKLRKYIYTEQQNRAHDQIPVRVKPDGTTVKLYGPEPAVEALAAKVTAFVEQAVQDEKERGFTMSFDFPQKHANQLIGKGGSNIRDLRDKYDVEIKVDDGKVELKGPKAKALAAQSHISALGKQWADEATYILKINPEYHRELIGAQGTQINRLQTRYKVQIHFPRSARPVKDDQSNADAASEAGRKGGRPQQEPDEVIVKGPKKGADEARDELLSLLQYLKDNSHTATVSVQQSQIPSLIGQRGSGMDELRQLTGARIDVPNARDSKDSSGKVDIQIKGTKAQVAQAKKLLEEKKTVYDSTVSKTLDVDKKYHSALIGTRGATIRDIIVKAGGTGDPRTVQFPKAESDGTIIIKDKEDVVDKIIEAIQQIVSERESQTTEEIEVPGDKHRSLIGRGGDTKKGLESKFKVSIDIPRQGSGQTNVKITGLPEDVEKAKTHILDLVKDQEGETVQVPRKFHHNIADNGQFFRKLRNDHQVTVDHAGHKPPPKPAAPSHARANGGSLPLITDDDNESADAFSWNLVNTGNSELDGEIPWVLRGPPDNLSKARAVLQAAIEQSTKNDTIGYLVLPDPRTYRYVIGQGGSKVNSIRKATGCKITVPRDQAKDEAIEISGSAEGVEKAKDLILKAVKDGENGNGNGNGSRA